MLPSAGCGVVCVAGVVALAVVEAAALGHEGEEGRAEGFPSSFLHSRAHISELALLALLSWPSSPREGQEHRPHGSATLSSGPSSALLNF